MAGTLAIIILIFVGYPTIKGAFESRQIEDAVDIRENGESLGLMRRIEGTDQCLVPLESDQSYAQSHYSKSLTSCRNFLFIDLRTNEQNWLFTQNEWLIANDENLYEKEYAEKDRKVIAILYNVVKSDTNKDKRLTEKDKITIALSDPSGKRYQEILPSIDKLIGHRLIGNDEVIVLYQVDNTGYAARFSLKGFQLVKESEFPKIKNNS